MAEQSTVLDYPANSQSIEPEEWPLPAAPSKASKGQYAAVIGAFQDDPMLDAMMTNIRERRREIDSDDTTE